MNILLIEPPGMGEFGTLRILASIGSNKANVLWPPYDLMIISGLLDKNNIENDILDAMSLRLSFDKIKEFIVKNHPKVVIFTTTVPSMDNDVKVADAAKSVSKDIITIAINIAMESSSFNYLEKYPNLDIAVYHDAEGPILDFIKSGFNPELVKGIYYRKNGLVVKNPPHPGFLNIDEWGIPSQRKVPFKLYRDPLMKRWPFTVVCCSRGCINQCFHCMTRYLNPLRYRSVDNVIQELELVQSLGIKDVKFFDCTLTADIQWANRFFEKMIKKNLNLTWIANVRADCLPQKTLELMKKAGCHSICIGSDSSSQKILDNIGKNETIENIEDAVKRIKNAGLRVLMFCTFGHVGETHQTMRDTLEFVKRLDPDLATFGIVVPVRGTKFYDYLKEHNYLLDIDISRHDPSDIPVYNYPELSAEEIYDMSIKAYREFYLRPHYILKRLFQQSLPNNMRQFFYFLKLYCLKSKRVKT